MNTWWYIHTATLYQLSCWWTPDDIYIPQLYINFPADEHVMIYTYRNFTLTFLPMITWWYIHTATLYQFSWIWTRDDIYIPQLYINFPADKHLIIYTYCNFISIFLQLNTWWDVHTATLYELSCRWSPDDIYIPQLYINFPADKHLMICTYRKFISTFITINTGWYIHTAALYQFPADELWMIYTYRNFISISLQMNTWWYIYILQLYINFPADDVLMIYTYRNFVSIFLQLNTWWYIHTATLYQFPCRWTRNDIYIPQLYINFPPDEHLMMYTYRNFISTFLQMNTWWHIHTGTWYQFSCSCTRDDIYIPQLYINFLADEHGMIYTYHNFISAFLQMNTWWYIHTAT